MVDRIVPATLDADIAAFETRTGMVDRGLVKTEPFTQWVIEDRFAGERPDLESAGVQVTAAVGPWETAKLRMLNGAHSAIAYLGGLAGIEFVHEFVSWPEGARLVERLWDESARTLETTPGLDVGDYRRRLMERFANPALQHRTRQIAMDGSQKLPPRLLAPIFVALERGLPFGTLALAVAAWIRWVGGRDDAGQAVELNDPLAAELRRAIGGIGDARGQVEAMLKIASVFPPALAADTRFAGTVSEQLERLQRSGAAVALTDLSR
jgi:fructuronate reductase